VVLNGRGVARRIKGTLGYRADRSQEFISTLRFGTSMLVHCTLGCRSYNTALRCSPIKAVRELGSEHREIVPTWDVPVHTFITLPRTNEQLGYRLHIGVLNKYFSGTLPGFDTPKY
jgi:hypothetical protein